jgi:hypothetical protein
MEPKKVQIFGWAFSPPDLDNFFFFCPGSMFFVELYIGYGVKKSTQERRWS